MIHDTNLYIKTNCVILANNKLCRGTKQINVRDCFLLAKSDARQAIVTKVKLGLADHGLAMQLESRGGCFLVLADGVIYKMQVN